MNFDNVVSKSVRFSCPGVTGLGAALLAMAFWTIGFFLAAGLAGAPALASDGTTLTGAAFPDPGSPGNRYVTAELITDVDTFQAAVDEDLRTARIGVLFKIEPGWHIYWKNSGDSAISTGVDWHLPAGWRAGDLQWPVPYKFYERSNLRTYGYHDEVLLFSNLYAPNFIPPVDQSVQISAGLSWLVCKDICVPGRTTVELNRTFGSEQPLTPSPQISIFDRFAALVPKPIPAAELQSGGWYLAAPGLTISAPKLIASAPGENLLSIFLVSNSGAKFPIDPEHLQIFPDRSEQTVFGEPKLYGPGEIAGKGRGFEIRLPFSASSLVKAGEVKPPGGVVAIAAGSASPGSPDLQIEWSPAEVTAAVSSDPAPIGSDLGALSSRTEKKEPRKGAAQPQAANQEAISLFQAILLAFIGGLILNLMPCVLPIISIKVLGFVEKCCGSRRDAALSAAYFSLGILATMAALAGAVVAFRSAGMQVGWGFQFQFPGFVAFLTLVIFVLALGFFEVYHFALPCQFANSCAKFIHHPAAKHSFDGVLTVLLSTPCTAPFLGTALAFGFSQSTGVIFAIFLAIGCGLSLPYVIFSLSPTLLGLLPKPGDWMHRFRQVMGFLMLLTVIWLLTVLNQLTEDGVRAILILMLAVFFLFWLRKQSVDIGWHARRGTAINLVLTAAFFGAAFLSRQSLTQIRTVLPVVKSDLIQWEPYSARLVQSSAAEKVPLFIDFTAAWCITCKANEKLVIETEKIAHAITGLGIRPVKADWTAGDPEITAALEHYGATGVPLYVVIPKDGAAPIVLPSLLSTEQLLGAFKTALNS